MPGALGADDQLIAFAQDHHEPIGLRQEFHELFEQLVEQRIKFESAHELVGDFENDLQLGCRILGENPFIPAGGIDGFANDHRRLLRLGRRRGRPPRSAKRYGPI